MLTNEPYCKVLPADLWEKSASCCSSLSFMHGAASLTALMDHENIRRTIIVCLPGFKARERNKGFREAG